MGKRIDAGANWADRTPFEYSPADDWAKSEAATADDEFLAQYTYTPDALDERLIRIATEAVRGHWLSHRMLALDGLLGSVPEKAFLYALIVDSIKMFQEPGVQLLTCPSHERAYGWYGFDAIRVCPQHRIGNYRCDFWIEAPCYRNERVIVEIDGHDFHEKTKEQVRRDKAREREIVATGIHVFRFSGSEIFADPAACVEQVTSFLISQSIRNSSTPENNGSR
jgi:very-short-patch-repair endonuclease